MSSCPLVGSSPSFRCLRSLLICKRPWICDLVCLSDVNPPVTWQTHSMSSKDFFKWSGRSLNFVDRVNNGGPTACGVDTLDSSKNYGTYMTDTRSKDSVRLWFLLGK